MGKEYNKNDDYSYAAIQYRLSKFQCQWVNDLIAHYKRDWKKIAETIDFFTGQCLLRLDELDVAISAEGKFYDRTSNEAMSFNHIRLIVADYIKHIKVGDHPMPDKTNRTKMAQSIAEMYLEFGLLQIERYKKGDVIDENLGKVYSVKNGI